MSQFSISKLYSFYAMMFLILPTTFLIRVLYSNSLEPKDFGLIYSIIAFYGILSFFTTAGVNTSFEYYIGKFKSNNNKNAIASLFQYNIAIKLILITITSTIVLLTLDLLANSYFKYEQATTTILIFLFYFIFLKFYDSLKSVFVAHQLNLYFQTTRLIEMLSVLIISAIFFLFYNNSLLIYYSIAWAIGTLLSLLIFTILTIKKFPYLFKLQPFNKELFKNYIQYGFSMFSAGIGSTIIGKSDIIIITSFLSLQAVAYYSNAIALVTTLAGTLALTSRMLMPLFSEHKEKGDYKTLRLIVQTLYTVVLFFLFPITLVFFLFPDIILSIIFGEQYVKGALALAILSLFLMIRILMRFNIAFVNGFGYAKQLSYIIFITAFFNLIGSLVAVQFIGIEGVAIISGISWTTITLLTFIIVKKELELKFSPLFFPKILLAIIVFVGLVYVLKETITIVNFYITGAVILSFSYLIYILLGYLFKIYTIEELYIFIPYQFKSKIKHYHQTYFKFLK